MSPTSTDRPLSPVGQVARGVYAPALVFEIGIGAIMPIIPLSAIDLGATLAVAGLMVALLGVGQIAAIGGQGVGRGVAFDRHHLQKRLDLRRAHARRRFATAVLGVEGGRVMPCLPNPAPSSSSRLSRGRP